MGKEARRRGSAGKICSSRRGEGTGKGKEWWRVGGGMQGKGKGAKRKVGVCATRGGCIREKGGCMLYKVVYAQRGWIGGAGKGRDGERWRKGGSERERQRQRGEAEGGYTREKGDVRARKMYASEKYMRHEYVEQEKRVCGERSRTKRGVCAKGWMYARGKRIYAPEKGRDEKTVICGEGKDVGICAEYPRTRKAVDVCTEKGNVCAEKVDVCAGKCIYTAAPGRMRKKTDVCAQNDGEGTRKVRKEQERTAKEETKDEKTHLPAALPKFALALPSFSLSFPSFVQAPAVDSAFLTGAPTLAVAVAGAPRTAVPAPAPFAAVAAVGAAYPPPVLAFYVHPPDVEVDVDADVDGEGAALDAVLIRGADAGGGVDIVLLLSSLAQAETAGDEAVTVPADDEADACFARGAAPAPGLSICASAAAAPAACGHVAWPPPWRQGSRGVVTVRSSSQNAAWASLGRYRSVRRNAHHVRRGGLPVQIRIRYQYRSVDGRVYGTAKNHCIIAAILCLELKPSLPQVTILVDSAEFGTKKSDFGGLKATSSANRFSTVLIVQWRHGIVSGTDEVSRDLGEIAAVPAAAEPSQMWGRGQKIGELCAPQMIEREIADGEEVNQIQAGECRAAADAYFLALRYETGMYTQRRGEPMQAFKLLEVQICLRVVEEIQVVHQLLCQSKLLPLGRLRQSLNMEGHNSSGGESETSFPPGWRHGRM
ncbi:hypothetical protein B0H17DRAFT_1140649 [Mycena rosella]|uniref:Uncharacterized protein n=1 Tax=Mycena rosella TaxID=1033263 RepID=A0AAD7D1I5_MYCRO|nr:hypothetical protein B0H17DRAFT_1140649 [Mycena rosella]